MNKKSLIKLGVLSLFFIIFLMVLLFLIFFIKNTSAGVIDREVYKLGESVKINFIGMGNYRAKIITPTKTYLRVGSNDIFLFTPIETGNYTVELTRGGRKTEYYFKVIEKEPIINETNQTIILELEKLEKTYYKGEELIINLIGTGDYKAEIITPYKNYSRMSKNDLFKLVLDELGNYNIKFLINGRVYNYSFEVIEKNEEYSNSSNETRIIIGEPVKWSKYVIINDSVFKNGIKIPYSSGGIIVYQIINGTKEKVDFKIKQNSIIDFIKGIFVRETEKTIILENIENISAEIEIEYYTDPPQKQEKVISDKVKEVIVYSPPDVNYENVLAYTNISEILTMDRKDMIKVYWKEENKYIDFNAYDTNGNGLIDRVEWIVPHLSEQTFNIIIITKAEHLDSNRDFISDIYNSVKELDNNWSEEIHSGDYIRITFEKNLTFVNDITIFPRIVSGNPKIEVYEVNGTNKIAEFSSLNSNEYNKVFLTELVGEQDSFDLRIVGGTVRFDHIIDPVSIYLINGDASNTATGTGRTAFYSGGKNIVRLNSSRLVAYWEDNSNDASCADSTTDGITWNAYSSESGTHSDTAIATNGSNIVYLTTDDSGAPAERDLVYIYRTTGICDMALGAIADVDAVNTNDNWRPDAAYDGANNQFVVCSSDNDPGDLDYSYTTVGSSLSWASAAAVGGARTIDSCSIDVNQSGTVFIAADDSAGSLVVFSSNNNFASTTTVTAYGSLVNDMHLSIRGSEILISAVDGTNLIVINSSNGGDYSSHVLAGTFSEAEGCIDSNGIYHIAIGTGTDIYYIQYNKGVFSDLFTIANTAATLRWPSVRCTNFPANNRMDNGELELVYTDTTNTDIYFANFTIPTYSSIYGNPKVAIINPQNITYNTNIIYFNLSLNEPGNCSYSLNNGINNYSMIPNSSLTGFSSSNNSISEGIYTVYAYCNDIAGNNNFTTIKSFIIDRTPPLININYPLNTTYNINVSELNYTINEIGGRCWYSRNNGVVNSTSVASGTNFTSVTSIEGNNNWTVYCNDTAGNINWTRIFFFKDTVYPLINYGFGTENDFYNFTRNWIYVNVSVIELNEANITFKLYNTTGPVNITTLGAGNRTINWTGLSDGRYYYNLSVRDDFSHENTTIIRQIGLDNTGPEIIIIDPENNRIFTRNYSLPLNYTINDNLVGYQSCWWNIDNEANNTIICGQNITLNVTGGDKNYVLYFFANDSLGNIGMSNSTFGVSTQGPAITLESPFDSEFLNHNLNIYFNYTPRDPDGVSSCKLYGNWTGVWQANATNSSINNYSMNYFRVNSITDGYYMWNIWCNDSNNLESFSLLNFSFSIDTVYPMISFGDGTEDDSVNLSRNSVYVNISVTEINEANITFNLYDSNHHILNSTTYYDKTRKVNWTNLIDGTYFYNITIYDYSSNYNFTNTRTIILDTTPPNGTLLTPANNTYTNNTVQNLTVNATDNTELSNVSLYVYNQTNDLINQTDRNVTGTNAVVGIVYTFLYDGIFKWFYKITDFVNNQFYTQNNTITIDTTHSLISFGDGTLVNGANVSYNFVYVNVSVTEINEANITFTLYNTTSAVNVTTLEAGNRTFNFTGLLDDNVTYYYNVSITDLANNINATETRIIKLTDALAPVILSISPLDGTTTSDPVTLSAITDENANCEYNITSSWNYGTGTDFTTTGGISHSVTLSFLGEGTYTYYIKCNDSLGNFNDDSNQGSTTFSIDNSQKREIKQIIKGNGTTSGIITYVTISPPLADITKAFHIVSYRHTQVAQHANTFKSSQIINTTTLGIYGDSSGGSAAIDFEYTIIEFESASQIYVQRKNLSTPASSTFPRYDGFLTVVNLSESFLLNHGHTHNAAETTIGSEEFDRIRLYNATTWEFNVNSAPNSGPQDNRVEIIDWNDNDFIKLVQRNLLTMDATSTSAGAAPSIAINRSNTLLFISMMDGPVSSTSEPPSELGLYATINSSGDIVIERGVAGPQLLIAWELVEFQPGTVKVQYIDMNFINTAASNTTTINAVNFNRSSAFSTVSVPFGHSGARASDTTVDAFDRNMFTIKLLNSTTVYAQRGTSTGTAKLGLQVFEILDVIAPLVNLSYPNNYANFSNFTINQFNFTVSERYIDSCELWGNWTGTWHKNQTIKNPSGNSSIIQNFSLVNIGVDGYYMWNVKCNDSSGNMGWASLNRSFTIDTTYPLISFGAQTEINYFNVSRNWIYVNVSVVEINEANITFGLYNNTRQVNATTFTNLQRTINWTNLPDGIYYYNVTITDYVNHINSTETRTITLDTTPPNGTLLTPANNTYTSNTVQNLTVNATDNTEFSNVSLYVYNQTNNLINQTDRSVTGTNAVVGIVYTFLYDGIFKWFYKITDFVNNQFYTQNNTITIDTTYSLISFGEGTSDNGVNVSRNWIYVNVSVIEINEANITFGLFNTSGIVNITTLGAGNRTFNWTSLSEGRYFYNVSVTDLANNLNYTETRNITLDTIKPIINIKYPLNQSYNINVSELNFTSNDFLSGVSKCWYSKNNGVINSSSVSAGTNFSFVTSVEGNNNWTVYCNDSAENINSSIVYFFKDTVFPLINIIYPPNATNSSNVNINVNYTYFDVNSGSCWWTNNSGDTNFSLSSCGVNITGKTWPEGGNNIIIYINDTLGNRNFSLVSFTIDTTYPLIKFGEGTLETGANVSRNWIYVNVTVEETNEANITFVLYNTTSRINITTFFDFRRTINWTNLADGKYYYNVSVYDYASNLNFTETGVITLDTTPPNGTLLTPTNNTITNLVDQNLTVNASDNTELANVSLYVYNQTNNLINQTDRSVTSANAVVGIVYTFLYDGIFKWFYKITDFVNNQFYTENNTITIDTTYSLISFGEGTLSSGANVSRNWIYVNVSVIEINEANITFGLFNTSGTVNITTLGSGNRTFNFTGLIDGRYYYNVSVRDLANNLNSTETRNITLDTTKPIVNIKYPQAANYTINITNLNYSYSDINPGYCWYSNNSGVWNSTSVNAGVNFTSVISEEGWNNWTLYCNDSVGNTNMTFVYFFMAIPPNITIFLPNGSTLVYNMTLLSYISGLYDLDILLYNQSIEHIYFYGFNKTGNLSFIFSSYTNETWGNKSFAISFIGMIFSYANLSILSNGSHLYKCNDWNMTNLTCNDPDNWEVLMVNNIGEYYNLTLNASDPGFLELTIADVDNLDDGYALESSPGTEWGARSYMVVRNSSGSNSYSMIKFNLTQIPEEVIIDSADLTLRCVGETLEAGESIGVGAHLIYSDFDWTEGTGGTSGNGCSGNEFCWNYKPLISQYNLSFDSSLSIPDGCSGIFYTFNVLNSVNYAYNQNYENISIYLIPNGSNIGTVSGDEIRLNTKEAAAANRPLLNITYHSIPKVIILSPTAGTNYNYSTIANLTIRVTDVLVNISSAYVNITLPNGTVETYKLTNFTNQIFNYSYNIPNLLGRYNITFIVNNTDNYINSSETTWFNSIDSLHPIIRFEYPTTNSSSISKVIHINVSSLDISLKNISISLYNTTGIVNYSNSSISPYYVYFDNLIDGIYYFNASSCDNFSNCNFTETRNVTIDITIPNGTLVTPLNNTYTNNATQNLTVNASDNTRLSNVSLYVYNQTNDLINQTERSVTGTNAVVGIVYTFLYDGIFKWFYKITDFVNNQFYTQNNTITIDTTYSLISFGEGTSDSGINVSRNFIYVNVSVTEINEANITFTLYNTTGLVNITTLQAGNRTFNFTNLIDGVYYYNVSVRDLANNYNFTETRTITLDTIKPIINIIYPINMNYSLDVSELNFTSYDSLSGVSKCWYSRNNGVVNSTSVNPGINFTSVTSIEGNNNWTVYCNDTVGNINSSIVYFFKDTIYPLINIITPLNNTYTTNPNINVNYTYFDVNVQSCWWTNDTGVSNYSLSSCGANITGKTWSQGLNTIIIYINDTLGNTNKTSVTFTLDTTYPLISFGVNTEVNSSNVSRNFVYVNVSVVEINEANITFTLYNTTGLVNITTLQAGNRTFNFTNLIDGVYYYNVSVRDLANNYNFTETRTITLDTTLPNGTLVTPLNNTYTNNATQNLTVNASDNIGLSNVTLNVYNSSNNRINQTDATVSGTNALVGIIYTFLYDGIFKWFYKITDFVNNQFFTQNNTITIDTTYPLISFGEGSLNSSVNISRNFIYVNVSVTEINEANITFTLYNTTSAVNITTLGSGNRTFNFTNLIDSVYYYNVSITDLANNINFTETRNITIDATSPLVSFGEGTELNDTEFERNWIYVNVSVTEINEANITFTLYNTTGVVNITSFTDRTRTINWTELSNKNETYYYNVSVYDYFNNYNSTETRIIKLVDKTNPFLILISPVENTSYDTNTSLYLIYSVSDLNLQSCWYNLNNGNNITLDCSGSTTFNCPEGNNTLYLFANDSLSNVNKTNVSFYANNSLVFTNDYYVERGNSFVDGTVNIDLYRKFDRTKSFIIHTSSSADGGPDSLAVVNNFFNSTRIVFDNYASGEGANLTWQVITGPDINVQRNQVSYAAADPSINVTINPINISSSFIIVNNRLNTGTAGNFERYFWTGKIINSTAITFQRDSTGTAGVLSYQVVDWSGVRVMSGNVTLGTDVSVSTYDLPSEVNLNNSFIIHSVRISGDDSIEDTFVRSYFVNSTRIALERYLVTAGSGGTLVGEWFVIEWNRFRTDSGSYSILATTNRQYITMNRMLINLSKSFDVHSHENQGTSTGYQNAFITKNMTNTTTMTLQKGTASNVGTDSWFAVEIIELDPPIVNLKNPINYYNFSSYYIPQFNFSVSDLSTLINCSLYGNWTGSWHKNQTIINIVNNISYSQNFSSANTGADGYYSWNVECVDIYNNIGRNSSNFSFSAFLPPESPILFNISQNRTDGTGNITILWNSTNHTIKYLIYYTNSLSLNFSYLNETSSLNFIDSNFSGNKRRFYRVLAWNPGSINSSSDIFGAHVYSLSKNSVNTRNWIGFPTNFSYLIDASTTLRNIINASAFTMWNETIQKRVTCNYYSCPNNYECTDTNCNFNFTNQYGRGYEVNLNVSSTDNVNWSGVGIVNSKAEINLEKNSSSFGKNWISLYANTSLLNAKNLLQNITDSDAVTKWDSILQRSRGLIPSPFLSGSYVGNNFSTNIEEAYEISVNNTYTWRQA